MSFKELVLPIVIAVAQNLKDGATGKEVRTALDSVLHHVEYQELRDVMVMATFLRPGRGDYKVTTLSALRVDMHRAELSSKFESAQEDWQDFHCVLRGLVAAAHAHESAVRKSTGAPYLIHPVEMVIFLLAGCGVEDVEVLVAALLHDTVEDSGVTIKGIQTMFEKGGYPRVHSIVAEVTDDRGPNSTREMRKRAQLSHAPHLSESARLVKSADMQNNLCSIIKEGPPSKWTVAYTQGYFLWKYEIVKMIQGVNTVVDMALQNIFEAGVFVIDGQLYPVLPEDTSNDTLEAYFAMC